MARVSDEEINRRVERLIEHVKDMFRTKDIVDSIDDEGTAVSLVYQLGDKFNFFVAPFILRDQATQDQILELRESDKWSEGFLQFMAASAEIYLEYALQKNSVEAPRNEVE